MDHTVLCHGPHGTEWGAQHVLCRAAISTRVELACEPFDMNIEYHGLSQLYHSFSCRMLEKDDNGRIVVVRE